MGNRIQKERNHSSEAIVLDVRSDEEFCRGHMRDAILVSTPVPPLTKRQKERLRLRLMRFTHHYPRDQPVYVYCKKGARAGLAVQFLEEARFTDVVSLGGVESGKLADLLHTLTSSEHQRIWWSPKQ